MNEAARMVEEGVASAEEIDKATRYGLGLRFAALGVVEFIDFGGADILHHASREMSASIDPHRYAAPAVLDRMMQEGRLGLKTGLGLLRLRRTRPQRLPSRRAVAHARPAQARRAVEARVRQDPVLRSLLRRTRGETT